MHLLCVAQKLFSSPQDVYIPIFHHPPPLSRESFFPTTRKNAPEGGRSPSRLCVCVGERVHKNFFEFLSFERCVFTPFERVLNQTTGVWKSIIYLPPPCFLEALYSQTSTRPGVPSHLREVRGLWPPGKFENWV